MDWWVGVWVLGRGFPCSESYSLICSVCVHACSNECYAIALVAVTRCPLQQVKEGQMFTFLLVTAVSHFWDYVLFLIIFVSLLKTK